MIRIAKIIQLLVSVSVVGLFWLIYPGVMVIVATAAGLIYVAAAVGALRDKKLASWIAFAFTLATAIAAPLAVLRFITNGFSYESGNFELHGGIYWPPYIVLTIAIGAALVVILNLVTAGGRDDDGAQS